MYIYVCARTQMNMYVDNYPKLDICKKLSYDTKKANKLTTIPSFFASMLVRLK